MKTNSKKKTTVILSIVLAAVVVIGATLAYLATKTEEASNVFTFADNIRARLDEPNWKKEDAENLIPGYEVKKDPMITNLSNNGVDEYAALKITFTDNKSAAGTKLSDAETVRLLNLLDITWNNNWVLKHGTLTTDVSGKVTAATAEQIYVYNGTLSPGEISDPIFSSVTIKSDISDVDYAWLAAIIMNHTEDCYDFNGTHDPAKCSITYKHHVNCPVHGDTDEKITAKGVTTASGKTCNCTPAEEHDKKCPILVGTLKANCGHTVDPTAIGGFQIKVQGAAVQANVDGMTAWNSAATIANLLTLFGITTP